jgi:thiamine-phosphate pyrophosphorylase
VTPRRSLPRQLPRPPVLLITDRSQATAPLEVVVAAALVAGCRWVVLREKDMAADARRDLLTRLVALGRRFGATIMVSDDLAAARAADAAGVHLSRDGDPGAARAALGPKALIGVSAHNATEAEDAARGGADYVTLSPIFESLSKPGYGPQFGLVGLRAVAGRLAIPVLALGGVTHTNAGDCLKHGAAGVAVMGAVMGVSDSGPAVQRLLSALSEAAVKPE